MSLIGALNSGLTGILSHQKMVEVTGNNIANVNTPGYSRQTATVSPNAAIKIQGILIGQGVNVQAVNREYDKFVTGQINDQNNLLGKESAKTSPLAELERVLGIGENSLASGIADFFGAWHDLSENPSGSMERSQVIYKGENLLDSFEQINGELLGIQQNIDESLKAKVNSINLGLREVADLNASISGKESLGQMANEERDRRDILVKELSMTLGVQTYETGNGQIGLQLPGGIPLVQGDTAIVFESYYSGNNLDFQVKFGEVRLPAERTNFGGEFRGLLDLRDDFIPGLAEGIESLQYSLITEVNAVHEGGYGLDGQTGRSFFTRPLSFQGDTGFADPEALVFSAGTLQVNGVEVVIADGENSLNGVRDAINSAGTGFLASVVHDGTDYRLDLTPRTEGEALIFTGLELADGTPVTVNPTEVPDKMGVKLTSIQEVAAAGVTQGAPGDNRNAQLIHALLNSRGGEQTFVDHYGRIASNVGAEARRNTMARGGAADTMNQLENLRESIVGVSIEEEMINLTMFQKGFEASSRFVRTVDEMLDAIISIKR